MMMYIRFPLSLRNVEDLLHERGIDITHETVRFWWNRFGPMFANSRGRPRMTMPRRWPGSKKLFSGYGFSAVILEANPFSCLIDAFIYQQPMTVIRSNRPANPPYQGRRTCLTLSFAERKTRA